MEMQRLLLRRSDRLLLDEARKRRQERPPEFGTKQVTKGFPALKRAEQSGLLIKIRYLQNLREGSRSRRETRRLPMD